MVYLWLLVLLAGTPFAIEVTAKAREAVVACSDSIGIEHGHDLEEVPAPEQLAELVVAD